MACSVASPSISHALISMYSPIDSSNSGDSGGGANGSAMGSLDSDAVNNVTHGAGPQIATGKQIVTGPRGSPGVGVGAGAAALPLIGGGSQTAVGGVRTLDGVRKRYNAVGWRRCNPWAVVLAAVSSLVKVLRQMAAIVKMRLIAVYVQLFPFLGTQVGRVKWSGVEWNGVEWGGVGWSGVRWSGLGLSAVE